MWLKVHRGIGLTSRAVDVWAAAPPPPRDPSGRHCEYKSARICVLCIFPSVRIQGIIKSPRAYSICWVLIGRCSWFYNNQSMLASFERVLDEYIFCERPMRVLWIAPAPGVPDYR